MCKSLEFSGSMVDFRNRESTVEVGMRVGEVVLGGRIGGR